MALLACLVLGLIVGPTTRAAASKGVYDAIGTPGSQGGEFYPEASSGGLSAVAVNSDGSGGAGNGDFYVVERGNNRVQRFDAAGNFISAWGLDVDAGGGAGYEVCTEETSCRKASTASGVGGGINDPRGIAIDQISGNVYVSNRLNRRIDVFSASGSFLRAWGQDVVASGPGNTGGFEICVAANGDVCKTGVNGKAQGAFNSVEPGIGSLAVAPAGAPNAGNILVADSANSRVQEFTATGTFVRAFGWNVVSAGPGDTGTGFEVCNGTAGDTCRNGGEGAGIGQFKEGPQRIAEDSSGNIYAVESSANFRIQRFTLPGNVLTPAGEFDPSELSGSGTANVTGDPPVAVAVDTSTPNGTPGTVYVLKYFPLGSSPSLQVEVRILEVDPTANGGVGKVTDSFAVGAGANSANALGLNTITGRIYMTEPPAPVYAVDNVPSITVSGLRATEIGSSTATLRASITPSPLPRLHTLYRFEYRHGDGDWTQVPTPEADIGNGISPVSVSQKISGLDFEATYQFRVVAHTQFNGTQVTTDGPVFTTRPTPPVVSTGAAIWSSPSPSTPSLLLGGTVNPGHDRSTYHFEYVEEASYLAHHANEIQSIDLTGASGGSFALTFGLGPEPQSSAAISQGASAVELRVALEALSNIGTDNVAVTGSPGGLYEVEFVEELADTDVPQLQVDASGLTPSGAAVPIATTTQGNGGFENAVAAPAIPAEAGKGVENVSVHQSISGLDPTKAYSYRLVATNSVDTQTGQARAVAPPDASDRFYELVSDDDSWGNGINGSVDAVAASGDRASFGAQAYGQPDSLPGPSNPYVASRGGSGWEVVSMAPRVDGTSESAISGRGFQLASDLGSAIWAESSFSELLRGETRFGLAHVDGTRSFASEHLVPVLRNGKFSTYVMNGASEDLSVATFVPYSGGVALLAGEPLINGAPHNLYEVSDGTLSIVNRASGKAGALIGGACGADLGARLNSLRTASHAISSDGSVVYFSARPTAPVPPSSCPATEGAEKAFPKRIYKRIGGETTVPVSESQCTRVAPPCTGVGDAGSGDDDYQGASTDGSVAFFTSPRQLTDSDVDATSDLYVYDADPPAGQPKLVQASAGEATPNHATVGSGAKAQGVLDNSTDGSRVYFVAESQLTVEASTAPGAKNLYVFERDEGNPSGRIDFVGTLNGSDASQWALGDVGRFSFALPLGSGQGDGHLLLFLTAASLVADDGDQSKDLYRYDDEAIAGARMSCLSCVGDAEIPVEISGRPVDKSVSNYAERQAVASADVATVVFVTRESLLGADENSAADVYAWRDGELSLISGGTEGFGVVGGGASSAISPDGRNIFFATRAPLVASDSNNALDLYDARVGGGFPAGQALTVCASNDQCQAAGAPAPAGASPPASTTLSGAGNQASPKPCKKGQVRKRGKCVRKPDQHKKKRHPKRASRNRGGSR